MATTSKIFVVIIFLAILALLGSRTTKSDAYVIFGDVKVKVEIVNTESSRARGLSGRPSLKEGTGMLFVFDTPGQYGFWMKDMKFAIDIIWFDEKKNIVYIKKDATPESFPEVFGGEENSLYVLEVPAGFADKYNLQIGDKAEIAL